MTRLLLAMLAFYRRWISPALHALARRWLQVFAYLFGVCLHRHCNSRPFTRHGVGRLEAFALPSIHARRPRSGAAGFSGTQFSPSTVTIRRAAA